MVRACTMPSICSRVAAIKWRHIRLESAATLKKRGVRALMNVAIGDAVTPFDATRRGQTIVRAISKNRRPRRGDFMTKPSRYPYWETIERLSKAITDEGNTIFATIDQAAAAKTVGLPLRPTRSSSSETPRAERP